jgi:hypothetical protein
MNKQRGSASGELIASLIVCAVFALPLMAVYNMSCKARWSDSGMAVSWGPIQGCKVQVGPSRWLPEDRVRETDIPKTNEPKAEVPR